MFFVTRHGMSVRGISPRSFRKPMAGSISIIINQYKSSIKRWCNKNGYDCFQWQPGFHDHIIRDQQSFQTIAEYIVNNPAKWCEDQFYICNDAK